LNQKQNVPVPVSKRKARSVENMAVAGASIEEDPNQSSQAWNCSSIGRVMLENRGKLGLACGLLQACPWWPCKRNRVSYIMVSNVLLQKWRILLISQTILVLF